MIFNNINVSMINKDIIRVQKYRFQDKNTLFIPTKNNFENLIIRQKQTFYPIFFVLQIFLPLGKLYLIAPIPAAMTFIPRLPALFQKRTLSAA